MKSIRKRLSIGMDFGMRSGKSNRKWMIWIGGILLFKILLMGLFSSDYQNQMFIPFVNTFLDGNNPYNYYYENGLAGAFPYFPVMLLCESVGGGIIRLFSIQSLFWVNFWFKLPLLLFDVAGLWLLLRMKMSYKYAVIIYFCSPIILYSTYMHGQLDIIPTVFLIASLFFLTSKKTKWDTAWYSVFLGLSLASKLHILAAVPILFLYVVKKKGLLAAIGYHALTAGVVLICSAPFFCRGFVETVLFNKEQSVLLNVYLDYVSTRLLIPVFVLLVLYFYVYQLKYINLNLLVSSLNLLFAVFLVCIPAMPAWFIWIVPFITLYFGYVEKNKHSVMMVYMIFTVIYLVYYIFLHRTEYTDLYFLDSSLQGWKMDVASLKYTVFTVLAASIVILIFEIYRFGVASNALYQRGKNAFAIGIAGDSGAGKSSLLSSLQDMINSPKDVLVLEGDGDHRWSRGDSNWNKYTALDPRANYLYRQAEDIRKLKDGIYVNRRDYDHDKGIFTEFRRVKPKKFVLLSGLHSLYLPQLRHVLDLKIYMDTDEQLRRYWKVQRDSKERGYSEESVLQKIEERSKDGERFIIPQKDYADIVIRYFSREQEQGEIDANNISVSIQLSVDVDMEAVISEFEANGVMIHWNLCDELTRQEIWVDGEEVDGKQIHFSEIAEAVIPQYEDILSGDPHWRDGIDGVVQLVLLHVISTKMRSAS